MTTNHYGQSSIPTLRSGYFNIMATANHVSGLPKRTSKGNSSDTAIFIINSSVWCPSTPLEDCFISKC